MHNNRFLRHQLRSVLVIFGLCAAIGTVYDAATGELSVSGPIVGLFVGLPLILFEVLFPLQFMRKWPFAASVFARAVLYITLLLLVFSSLTFIYGLAHGLTLNDFYEALWSSDTVTQVGVGFGAFVVIIFFQQLNRLLGPGTLVRYIFGRYYRPRQEARIFMFLDLKDSTSIAERLDVGSYYALLNDVFHDIAEPVLATRAQIYQYVGDQVVLTWPMARGLHDANCVRVFYAIDAMVERRRPYYLERYGLIPEYKAAVHGGEVISAEIGDLKRDLVYSGDVLNTTARIQSECNRLEARLLVSAELFGRLVLPPGVKAENVGEIDLRGKRHAIGVVRLWDDREAAARAAAEQLRIRENQAAPTGLG
jgi:adenylate cyclase